ncbi:MAG: uroporphyrin-III C-methyltransferase [Anaerosporomusa subterranea]|jgi:uroporphyrinogen III methyltransferase/synthase|nr:uroporphyrin-III C-methyltransferase [Anaerosporomusa subterranea]
MTGKLTGSGIVYLVGAGPGDFKLITVKGLERVKLAETIVYDRLADERLLEYARPDVELIYVGKSSNDHTMKQEEINQVLIDRAKAGKAVVRLKGGDPFVFGRGGEEALALLENGIAFEIVPGVTSAIAAAAYAGIPVTHRGIATSFAVVTGHEDPTKPDSSIRWEGLADGPDTLVFLMGVENLPTICAKLIEHGRNPATPAAIIRWGTKPEQQVWLTTLESAAEEAAKQQITPPAIFLVGEVAALREKLAWFDTKPLFGKTVLVTRAREQASMLTERLESLGARCYEAPAIKVVPPESYEPLDHSISHIGEYQWLILTSVNGVDAFFNRLHLQQLDARALNGVKVVAIGAATAARLKEHGVYADLIPVEFRAEGILHAIAPLVKPGMRILIPRALIARDILPEKLQDLGAAVDVVPAYRTVTGEADRERVQKLLSRGEIDLVTFTSSSTVINLLTLLGEGGAELLNSATVACIGPVTATTCRDNAIRRDIIAEEFTVAGLVEAISQHYQEGIV